MKTESTDRLLLIGCGILRREIFYLIERNGWQVDTQFLASTLHVNLNKLGRSLKSALNANSHRETVVFYGCCHPEMESVLQKANTVRTCGQNCIEMLLGQEMYLSKLKEGAFFLLEDWVGSWERILKQAFGTTNMDVIKEIFAGDLKFILAIRTPCTRDFTHEAAQAGEMVGLPVQWMDASLDHLESVLQETLTRKLGILQ